MKNNWRDLNIGNAWMVPAVAGVILAATGLVQGAIPVECIQPSSDMPPLNCPYVSPDDLHMIADGLPVGTEIELDPIHRPLLCRQTDPISNSANLGCENCDVIVETDPDNPDGKIFKCREANVETELVIGYQGTGDLASFNGTITIDAVMTTFTGAHNDTDPVQTFPTEMTSLVGTGTNGDFASFDIRVGRTELLTPSPGETTLTTKGDGTYNVDSFFDVFYEITYTPAPGSPLDDYCKGPDGIPSTADDPCTFQTESGSLKMQAGVTTGIPILLQWGVVILILMILTSGAVILRQRRIGKNPSVAG